MESFLSEAFGPGTGGRYQLVDASTGFVLVPHLEVAVQSATRKKGLLGRDGLPPGHGLVIAPTSAVHTFFMRFPIDIVFVNRGGAVLKVRESVPAWRVAGALRGYAVVELAAGGAAAAGLREGGRVSVRPVQSGEPGV